MLFRFKREIEFLNSDLLDIEVSKKGYSSFFINLISCFKELSNSNSLFVRLFLPSISSTSAAALSSSALPQPISSSALLPQTSGIDNDAANTEVEELKLFTNLPEYQRSEQRSSSTTGLTPHVSEIKIGNRKSNYDATEFLMNYTLGTKSDKPPEKRSKSVPNVPGSGSAVPFNTSRLSQQERPSSAFQFGREAMGHGGKKSKAIKSTRKKNNKLKTKRRNTKKKIKKKIKKINKTVRKKNKNQKKKNTRKK